MSFWGRGLALLDYLVVGRLNGDGVETRPGAPVQTVDEFPTVAFTYTPPADGIYLVVAHSLSRQNGGTERAARIRIGLIELASGAVTQIGTSVDGDQHLMETAGAAAWDLVLTPNGNTLDVEVVGQAATTIDHRVDVQVEPFLA